jgi:hypothetical protein
LSESPLTLKLEITRRRPVRWGVLMARSVGVHGIAQQFKGPETMKAAWMPSLRDGVLLARLPALSENDLAPAFYGDLFRPQGKGGDIPYTAEDVTDDWEKRLLLEMWEEASALEDRVPSPDETETKGGVPRSVQAALNALTASRFFVGIVEPLLIGDLKQVRSYMHDAEVRSQVWARIESVVEDDSVLMIGHSLGSVVAYETLCAHPEWPIRALITLGSPLGIRNLIFGERLIPPPAEGRGAWPSGLERWTNIADQQDVVALVKKLAGPFGPQIKDVLVANGATEHDIMPYLTAKETGAAVAEALDN